MLKKLTFFIFCLFLASGAFAATLKDTTVTGDLTVTGTVAGNGSLLTNVPGTVSSLNSGYLSRSSTSTTIVDSGIYQDANGNIGIGTSAPEAKLEVDGIIYGTNVGINTTAPAGRLEVDGNIYVKNASIGVNTTGPAASLEVDSAGTTSATAAFILNNAAKANLITVLDNGNVGIGTTAPTQLFQVGGNLTVGGAGDTYVAGNLGVGVASPTVALDVSGTVRGSAFIGDGSALTNVAGGISSLNPGYLPRSSTATTVVDSGVYQDVNGNVGVSTSAPRAKFEVDGIIYGTNIGVNSTAPQARLDVEGSVYFSAGNVGINTTGTRALLEVGNAASVTAGSNAAAIIKNDLVVDGKIYGDGSGLTSVAGALSGLTSTRVPVASGSNSLVDSVIYNVGNNVGIGTTAPQTPLEVDGNIYIQNANIGINTTAAQATLEVDGAGTTSATNALMLKNAAKTLLMKVWDNGNVGIGTTNAAGVFEVNGGTAAAGLNATSISLLGQNAGSGGHTGGSIYLTPGTGTSANPDGAVYTKRKMFIQRDGNDGYVTSNAGAAYPTAFTIDIQNTFNFDYENAITLYEIRNAAAKIQYSFFGAVSMPGASNYTSAFVWGQQTGVTSYAERMRIDTSGNLGIGSTGPVAKLDVEGSVYIGYAGSVGIHTVSPRTALEVDGGIYGTNIGVNSTAPQASLDVEGSVYFSAGNVGINTTGTRALLEVGNAASVTAGSNAGAIIKNDLVVDGKIYGDGSGLTSVAGALSGLSVTRVPVASSSNSLVDTVIYNVGNQVGIGTSAPAYALDVVGDIKSSGNLRGGTTILNSSGLYRGSTSYGRYYMGTATVTGASPMIIASGDAATYTDGYISLYTSGSEKLRVNSTGNVGIGTTGPRGTLEVDGTTYLMVGNVGINTTAPAAKLEVDGNIYVQGANIGINTTGTRALLEVGNAASVTAGSNAGAIIKNDLVVDGKIYGDGSHLTSVAGAISGLTGTTTYGTIPRASGSTTLVDSIIYQDLNGNIGIGTTAPKGKLEVDGILYATSIGINTTSPQTALDINGSIQATGTGNVFVSGNVGIGTTAPTQVLGVNGVIAHVWGAPIPVISACGTGPAVKGTDNAFEITVGTSATGCTATFAGTYGDAVCTVTNQSVSVVNAMTYTVSATAVTITQANSGGNKIDVYCDFKN